MSDERVERAVTEVRRAGLLREFAASLLKEMSEAGVAADVGCLAAVTRCNRSRCCGVAGRGPCPDCERVVTAGGAPCGCRPRHWFRGETRDGRRVAACGAEVTAAVGPGRGRVGLLFTTDPKGPRGSFGAAPCRGCVEARERDPRYPLREEWVSASAKHCRDVGHELGEGTLFFSVPTPDPARVLTIDEAMAETRTFQRCRRCGAEVPYQGHVS